MLESKVKAFPERPLAYRRAFAQLASDYEEVNAVIGCLLKEEASAAVKQEKELAQADVAAILEQVKKDLKDEANDWGSRAIGGLGEAIGTYGSSGSIWAALASLAGSIFYAKSKAERLAMQTQIARDAKYLPGGPFAVQVAPMQQAFAAAPTAPAYQVPAGYRLVPNVTGSLAPLDKA